VPVDHNLSIFEPTLNVNVVLAGIFKITTPEQDSGTLPVALPTNWHVDKTPPTTGVITHVPLPVYEPMEFITRLIL
jgi:hypothetical protein